MPADIAAHLRAQFHSNPPARLGIAVSGGGDSMALLHGLHDAFADTETQLFAATVNHGLRPEAAREAALVAEAAARMGLPHDVLTWTGWNRQGNLQNEARRARYRLLADWARGREVALVALGHTADDQAETVLMRLARASGVNGLSAIPPRRIVHGVTFLRPLLDLSRAALRDYLAERGAEWAEDPSNDDTGFDRVKARRALEALAPLGIDAAALAQVAANMRVAREALDWFTFLSARDLVCVDGGDVVLDLRKFRTLPEEIARRLVSCALRWIGGDAYPPRRAALSALLEAIADGTGATLAGCHVLRRGGAIWICREYASVAQLTEAPDAAWDNRWRIDGPPPPPGAYVAALGEAGLALCPNWRAGGRPHAAMLATPALWNGGKLVSAPLAMADTPWTARLVGGSEEFFAFLLSH
jgi:tRNA(Ile)-lysidine synthase